MSYKISTEDLRLQKWFTNDNSCGFLRGISLDFGSMRGLKPFSVEMNFPVTVIAGKNGSGKTTLLAMAACAFHNIEDGYKLLSRKTSYYTFSDFLIQSKGEVPPEGILIAYKIAYDKWINEENPRELDVGVYTQSLVKMPGGGNGHHMLKGFDVQLSFSALIELYHILKKAYLKAIERHL